MIGSRARLVSLDLPHCALNTVCICQEFEGGDVRFGDVSNKDSLRSVAFRDPVDVVVSCLASRTGGKVCFPRTALDDVAFTSDAAWSK